MKNNQRLYILVVIVIIISIATSFSVFAVQLPADTFINIEYPKFDAFPIDEEIDFRFYAFDSSAYVLTDATTDCGFTIFNTTGDSLVFNASLSYDTPNFEYFYAYTFDTLGKYQGVIYCNNSQEAGFVSFPFEVTPYGNATSDDLTPLAVLILLPLLFGVILILATKSLGDTHPVLKTALFLVSYLSFWFGTNIGLSIIADYFNTGLLIENLSYVIMVTNLIFIFIIVYYFIYILILIAQSLQKQKEEELRY